jgi:peptidoglycan hydrolase-like protein with peptidoglycan-binding domain
MIRSENRQLCPYCEARLSAEATVCHGCGAVRALTRYSLLQLFFLYPLVALALALTVWTVADAALVAVGATLALSWLALGVAHVAYRRNHPRWLRKAPDEEPPLVLYDAHAPVTRPSGFSPWVATAITVAIGTVVLANTAPRPPAEVAANISAIPLAPATPIVAAAPPPPAVTVAAAAPTESLTDAGAIEPPATAEATLLDRQTIAAAQKLLADLGYAVGSADGVAGPRTRAAVRTFREKSGLGGDALDAALLTALESAPKPVKQLDIAARPLDAPMTFTGSGTGSFQQRPDSRAQQRQDMTGPLLRPEWTAPREAPAPVPVSIPSRVEPRSEWSAPQQAVSAPQRSEPRGRGESSRSEWTPQQASPAPQPPRYEPAPQPRYDPAPQPAVLPPRTETPARPEPSRQAAITPPSQIQPREALIPPSAAPQPRQAIIPPAASSAPPAADWRQPRQAIIPPSAAPAPTQRQAIIPPSAPAPAQRQAIVPPPPALPPQQAVAPPPGYFPPPLPYGTGPTRLGPSNLY